MDEKMRGQLKLARSFRALGIAFAEARELVELTNEIATAGWAIFSNGTEKILVNSTIAAEYPENELTTILRHEFLHRAMYDGIQEAFSIHDLANIALDAVINRLIHLADKEAMVCLSKRIYPEVSFSQPVSIANCTLGKDNTAPEFRELYNSIWNINEVPNPSAVYYKLLRLCKSNNTYKVNGWFVRSDTRNNKKTNQRSDLERAGVAILRRVPGGQLLVEKYCGYQSENALNSVRQFLNRQELINKANRVVEFVGKGITSGVATKFYPYKLSRRGVAYLVSGVSELSGLYWNTTEKREGENVTVYLDSSGSMLRELSLMTLILNKLSEIIDNVFTFDTTVYPITIEQIAAGQLRGGGGTDFSVPIRHFINNGDVGSTAILITDGAGSIDHKTVKDFNRSGKKCLLIFVGITNREAKKCELMKLLSDYTVINTGEKHA